MADEDTATKTSSWRRVCLGVMGVALAAGTALDLAATIKVAWLEEANVSHDTDFPASVLADNVTYSYDTTNPARYVPAQFTGMRAGTLRACFTLMDPVTTPLVEKTWCASYRSEADILYVSSSGNFESVLVSMIRPSLCDIAGGGGSSSGIPSDSEFHDFLDKFCRFQGYLPAIFQIAAIPIGLIGFVGWVNVFFSSQSSPGFFSVAVLGSYIGAILSLATFVVWVGAFDTSQLTTGASASLTIVAIVAFAIAAIAGTLVSRRELKTQYVPANSPA